MVLEAIRNRRSVRQYKSDPISNEIITDILTAAKFSPTGMNNRAVEFIIVTQTAQKQELCNVLTQKFLVEAPVLLIPVSKTQELPGLSELDLAVASATIFIQAAAYGLGTVWKHVHPSVLEQVTTILKLPLNYTIINVIPLGYAVNDVDPHHDEEFSSQLIHQNCW